MKIRVGHFELDLRGGQLQAPGVNTFLAEQPLRILSLLLKRPGEIVTRSEIQRELWPNGTVVEFDHSINVAVRRLRDAFGESATAHKYVQTVRGRGYRLVARATRAETQSAPIESLVVLPFGAERNDSEAEFFGDRITESITNSLTQLREFHVVSRATAFRYKRQNIDTFSIGRDLSVRRLVTGRVAIRKSKVVVGAELIDVHTDTQLWGARFRRGASHLCRVQGEIAREICKGIRDRLTKVTGETALRALDGSSSTARFERREDCFPAVSFCPASHERNRQ
jgi:TolB-like protein